MAKPKRKPNSSRAPKAKKKVNKIKALKKKLALRGRAVVKKAKAAGKLLKKVLARKPAAPLKPAAGKPAAFILNACDSRVPEVAEARNVLIRHSLQVAPIDIGQRVSFSRAVASGQSVTEFDAQGKAAKEIVALWHWLKHQLGSL